MKILKRNLYSSTFVVWEMKRNVSVVRFIFRCNIPIIGKIIKEMPDSVASGTPCITLWRYFLYCTDAKLGKLENSINPGWRHGKCNLWGKEENTNSKIYKTHEDILSELKMNLIVKKDFKITEINEYNVFDERTVTGCYTSLWSISHVGKEANDDPPTPTKNFSNFNGSGMGHKVQNPANYTCWSLVRATSTSVSILNFM